MANHEQLLRAATSMATAFLEEHGDEILDERTYDDVVNSFYGLFECNEECFSLE